MDEEEFKNTVRNLRCLCCLCNDLKKDVIKYGSKAVDDYNGMICNGVSNIVRLREKVDK